MKRMQRTRGRMRFLSATIGLEGTPFDVCICCGSDIALKTWPEFSEIVPKPSQMSPNRTRRNMTCDGTLGYTLQMIRQQMIRAMCNVSSG